MRLKTDSRTNVKRYVAELIIMRETDVVKKPRCWRYPQELVYLNIHWQKFRVLANVIRGKI
jgi:hypothetical protein